MKRLLFSVVLLVLLCGCSGCGSSGKLGVATAENLLKIEMFSNMKPCHVELIMGKPDKVFDKYLWGYVINGKMWCVQLHSDPRRVGLTYEDGRRDE